MRHLLQLDHHIRDLNILLLLVLSGNLKDDVLLVLGYWLLADVLDKLAHTVFVSVCVQEGSWRDLRERHPILQFGWRVE